MAINRHRECAFAVIVVLLLFFGINTTFCGAIVLEDLDNQNRELAEKQIHTSYRWNSILCLGGVFTTLGWSTNQGFSTGEVNAAQAQSINCLYFLGFSYFSWHFYNKSRINGYTGKYIFRSRFEKILGGIAGGFLSMNLMFVYPADNRYPEVGKDLLIAGGALILACSVNSFIDGIFRTSIKTVNRSKTSLMIQFVGNIPRFGVSCLF